MFVENLVQILQERNISAYKLSKDTGINQSTISQWKSGVSKPSLDAARKIADYLGVSVDYLLGRDVKSPPSGVEDGLDEEEEELIDLFRVFNRDGQLALLNTARGFAAGGLYIKRDVSGLAKDA